LVSFKIINIYIIFIIFFKDIIFVFYKDYICYIVCIIKKKYKYSLLQYKSVKNLLSIPIILIKIS